MTEPSCGCRSCRRSIAQVIERYYRRRPVWMDLKSVQAASGLGSIDDTLFDSVVCRMVRLGQLIKSNDPGDPHPVYLSARVMVPVKALAEAVEGGRG